MNIIRKLISLLENSGVVPIRPRIFSTVLVSEFSGKLRRVVLHRLSDQLVVLISFKGIV